MKYSYIEARKKSIISSEVGLVLSFFGVIFLFVIGVILYLSFKIDTFEQNKLAYEHKIKQVEYQTSKVDEDIEIIENSIQKSEEIHKKNIFFLTSIQNLLEMVPDKITLSKVELESEKLTLYGVTPTKDLYNLLLLAPLKSIFDKSYTSFYLQQNGWYKFVSYNSMDNNMTIFRNK
jgi:Tfp pilus assembly protein PilN